MLSVAAAAVGIAACQQVDLVSPAPTPPLLQLPSHSISGAGGVEYEGTLRSDGSCFWLTSGNETMSVIWPNGYSGLGGDRPALVHAGVVLARVGDTLGVDATRRADVKPAFCAVGPSSLIVGSVDSVNGRALAQPTAPGSTAVPRPIR
jgi:hypothetical protein